MYKIAWLPGDGVGIDVLETTKIVLDKISLDAEYIHGDIGWEFWCKEGDPLPQRTIDLLTEHKIGLFGAITSKPKGDAAAELSPALRGKGLVYYSPIVALRQRFDLDLCLRPCKTFPGNPLNFVKRGADGSLLEPVVDVMIFRQNTEGLYSGVEWTNPPDQVYAALGTHPKMKPFLAAPRQDLAVSCRIFTRNACRRILRAAFEYAKQRGKTAVTVCEKPNVISETSGMMLEEAKLMAKEFPGIAVWDTNVDAMMMWLTKNPQDYGVIVAGNMFGDIISDGFAGLVGGLGFACSANIGREVAVFEPTHGSAPKYADLNPSIVNPIAMILSACMMLDHLGENPTARRIEKAIAAVVAEGKTRTYDMLMLRGSARALNEGAASTKQLTDAIIAKL